jgi:MscS family membrane protein
MKKTIIYCLFILSAFIIIYSLSAQNDRNIDKNVEFDSPYNTIHNHLFYLQKENYKPEISAKALNSVRISLNEKEELAIKLKRIFDGKALIVNLENIPKDNNYIDSITGKHIYILFPELEDIYVEKYGSKWLYSKESVDIINKLYSETFPFDAFTYLDDLSPVWKNSLFGIYLWQYTGFIILLLICTALYFLFIWIFGVLLVHLTSKLSKYQIYIRYVKPIKKQFSFLLAAWTFGQLSVFLDLPIKISYFLTIIIQGLLPILLTIIFYKLSELVVNIFDKFTKKSASNIDDQLVPFFRRAIQIIVVILGIFYFLKNIGVDITPLIAGISIGGLAFALAAQDTIKNLFGSFTIFTDQPFQIGDWIVFEGSEGTVEEIGIRSTRIRTFYNSLVSVPNGKLADIKIDNMGRRQYRRFVTNISITYDTPPELIDLFVKGLRKIVENHPKTRRDSNQIYLNNLSDSSIQILFYIFFEVPDWSEELGAKHEILSEVIKLANLLNIRFAFPTQTLHIEEFPDNISESQIKKFMISDNDKLIENYKPFSDD